MTSPSGLDPRQGMCSGSVMPGTVGLSPTDFEMAVGLPYDLHASSCGDSSSESHSPDLPQAKASDRESRIIAEKQRRSQYNGHIQEMMALVSDIVHSQRKVDKTSVLRLAANKLRNEHVFGNTVKCCHLQTWSSGFLKFFDLFGGFMMAITCRGRIFSISPNVQEKLGHCHIDLLGQDIYSYIHPEDKELLRRYIYPPELQNPQVDNKLLEQHHEFNIRIMRAGGRSDPPRYERCRIDGTLRRSDRATSNGVQDEQIIRRQRVRNNRTFSSSGNDFVFIGMVHILSSNLPTHRMLPPTAYSEYWTRHLIDGRIVQCDQSISLVSGYMIEEVTGTSAFYYMHKEDVRWVICVLRQMYDQSREFGESYYRLMSRSGHFIYMRTRGFLEIDKNTKQVQSFVCVNSIVSEEYGKGMLEEMKRKYSVVVDAQEQQKEHYVDEAPVEHPKRLERIVMHLVEQSGAENQEELKLMAPSKENIIAAIMSSEKIVQDTGMKHENLRKRKGDEDIYEDEIDYAKRHSGSLGPDYGM